VGLPENETLSCVLKLCNIPGTIVVLYHVPSTPDESTEQPMNQPQPPQPPQFHFFILNIRALNKQLQKQWKKLYVYWAQLFSTNIEFNLQELFRA